MSKNKQDSKQLLQDSFQIRFSKTEAKDGKIIGRGEFARAGVPTANKRIYPESIWRKNLLRLENDIRDRKVLAELDHPCFYSDDFRVLTLDGWKEFKDVQIGDKVWSRQNGKVIVSDVLDIINQPYSGLVYEVTGRSFKTGVTPAHKFVTIKYPHKNDDEELITAQQLANKKMYHHVVPKTAKWNTKESDFVIIPGVQNHHRTRNDTSKDLKIDAKLFAGFVGIFLAEGTFSDGKSYDYDVEVCQSNEWSCNLIYDELLSKFPQELQWYKTENGYKVTDIRLWEYLRQIGYQSTRFIPQEVKNLDESCLKELIFWFTIGDGRFVNSYKNTEQAELVPDEQSFKSFYWQDLREGNGENCRQDLFCTSERLIRDLHECLIKSGGSGSLIKIIPEDRLIEGRLIKAENSSPLWQLHVSTVNNIWLESLKFTPLNHVGNIYCLSVTHGNFYVEQNGQGFWTGNCDGKTKLQRVSHLITNLELNPDGVITGEFEVIENTPNGSTLKALIDANATLGVSSRGYGSVKMNESGHDVVQDDYVLMTFDVVSDPANATSWPEFSREGSSEEAKKVPEAKVINEAEPKVEKPIMEEPEKKIDSVESPKARAEAELNIAPVTEPYAKPEFATQFYGVYSNQKEAWASTTPEKIFVSKDKAQEFADDLNGKDKEPAQKARYIVKPMDVEALTKYTNESVELLRGVLQETRTIKTNIVESKGGDEKLKEICAENAQLTRACKDLGFGLFLHKSLAHHPKCGEIISGLGNLQRYESIEQLKSIIQIHVEDADNFKRMEKTAIQNSMMKFEKEIDVLREETKKISESKDLAMSKIAQAKEKQISELSKEINSLREENKEIKAKLFLESKLVGNPNAILVRKAWEANKVLSEDKISMFVESMTRPIEQKPLFESVREGLSRRLPGNKINNMVEESVSGTTLSDALKSNQLSEQRVDPSVQVSLDEYKKLSGVR